MTCPHCSAAAIVAHWGFASGCKGCAARSLGRIFLGKDECGRRFRRACEQLGVSEDQVRAAYQQDAATKPPVVASQHQR